jgi:hypothetical protein
MTARARRLFNELANKLNLKCPRCEAAFHDYEGCNALKCSVTDCNAAFCAVCLKDCGHDAHQHVRDTHPGGLFDKGEFESARKAREQEQISTLLKRLSNESAELRQLVLNHIQKAKLAQDKTDSSATAAAKKDVFLQKTKASLSHAVCSDRLALLSNPDEYNGRKNMSRDSMSPRCAIPSDYRLSLNHIKRDLYQFTLEHNILPGEDYWTHIDDIEAHFKENSKIESLLNVAAALRNAVVAFDGHPTLYQTSRGNEIPEGHQVAKDEVCILLKAIDRHGNVEDVRGHYEFGRGRIIGLNQNLRMLLLESHVRNKPDSELMFEPLQHLIGMDVPLPLLTEIEMDVPDSQLGLNDEQKKVAHPLSIKTAMEVAGPPGTGKTKTIVELVRALLQCTSYDLLVLSERNGAINAIAEKFKTESTMTKGKTIEITDLQVWMSVMAYGAGDTMGESTKFFTLEEKLK